MSQLALSSIDSSLIEEISSKKNEPSWLKEYRKNSLSIYHDLPAEVSPLYNKYTDARKMNPEQVSLSISSDSSVPDFLAKRLDEIKNEISIVQIGSNIHSINIDDELKSKNVRIYRDIQERDSGKNAIILDPDDYMISLFEPNFSAE